MRKLLYSAYWLWLEGQGLEHVRSACIPGIVWDQLHAQASGGQECRQASSWCDCTSDVTHGPHVQGQQRSGHDADGAALSAEATNSQIDVWLRMPLHKLYVLVCIALAFVLYLTARSRSERLGF